MAWHIPMIFLLSIISFFHTNLCILLPSTPHTHFPMIFQFGDSLSDTGNKVLAFPNCSNSRLVMSPPYGMTYFKHPSKRICDGRLIIDFIAQGLGLPLLDPYLANANFTNGVDFAVAGGTALKQDLYKFLNVLQPETFSLETQLNWFLQFKSKFGGPPTVFEEALYVVGEIGGNDYGTMWKAGWGKQQVESFIEKVIKAVEELTRNLYAAGARKFLMVNLPLQGCNPMNLQLALQTDQYDEFGCILRMKEIGQLHNRAFDSLYRKLQVQLTGAQLWYGDFYKETIRVMQNPQNSGIENVREACCGIFTNNINVNCGETRNLSSVVYLGTACSDPSKFLFWNENHYTEQFNKVVANEFLSVIRWTKPSRAPALNGWFRRLIVA